MLPQQMLAAEPLRRQVPDAHLINIINILVHLVSFFTIFVI